MVGSDLYVDARVLVEVDEQRGVSALAHAEEGQGNRFCHHRVVEDTGVGVAGRCQMPGSPGRPSNGAGASPASSLTKMSRPSGRTDAEYRGPRCAGAVGSVGEEVTEAGEPEQAVGPGVVAEQRPRSASGLRAAGRGMRRPAVRRMPGAAAGARVRRRVRWRPGRRCRPHGEVPMSSPCPPEVAW